MAVLKDNFRTFLSEIEPNESRAKTAQQMPGKVRKYLQSHMELKTVEPHTRLAGSYGRRTANGRIKDVDIPVFVSDDYEDDIPGLLRTLRDALDDLPEELNDCGEVSTRLQRRSVNVELEKHDLSLDIVPVRLTTDDHNDVLLVPDREWKRWVKTQPLGYGQHLSDLNRDHEGKVVPLVKMLKHWRDTHFARRRPKSYWLECLVVRHIEREFVTTCGCGYGEIVADLFESIHAKLKAKLDEPGAVPSIPDPMLGNEVNVAWNWDRSHFETFMKRVDDCRNWARRAVEEEDDDEAVELWQKVFGTAFPDVQYAKTFVKGLDLGAGSSEGRNWVTGTGLVTATPIASAICTAAPVKRFYGD